MRKVIIASIISSAVLAAGLLAFDAQSVLGVIGPVTPYDADVNKDGHVNSTDMLNVAKNFWQACRCARTRCDASGSKSH